MSKKKAVIFDLDNTLADIKDEEAHHKKRHESFAKEAENAPEIKKNVKKLHKEQKKNDIVILTARSAHYEPETKDWLKKHDINPDRLVMRPADDTKDSDKKVKKKLLKKDVSRQFNVKKAYDDKEKNIKMFEKQGIKGKKV